MKRFALIAASSAAALAATFAMAQPQPVPPAVGTPDRPAAERSERAELPGDRDQRGDWRERRAERMQERLNERLTTLRADMKLRPEQIPLFDAVEAQVKKGFEQRGEAWRAQREQREALRHADIMERLDAMSANQSGRAERTKALADAVRPLWATLSDEQKTVTRRAMRDAMAEGHRGMERMHGRHGMDERHERRGEDRMGGGDRMGGDRMGGRDRIEREPRMGRDDRMDRGERRSWRGEDRDERGRDDRGPRRPSNDDRDDD